LKLIKKHQPVFKIIENFFYVILSDLNYLDDEQINVLDLKVLSIIYTNSGIKVLVIQERLSACDI